MNQEDKDLLLKDLCARLLYGVKISINDKVESLQGINILDNVAEYGSFLSCDIEEVRLYLFPISSMTEEQRKELKSLGWNFDNFEIHNVNECLGTYREYVAHSDCFVLIDWLNKNHFDYRGLIPKDLAVNCTNLKIY